MATDKVQVGIIGTGNILGAYVRGTRAFEILDLVACADIDVPKAKARAAEFDIPRVCTVEELLAQRVYGLALGYDLREFAQSRYNLLGGGITHWLPGMNAARVDDLENAEASLRKALALLALTCVLFIPCLIFST